MNAKEEASTQLSAPAPQGKPWKAISFLLLILFLAAFWFGHSLFFVWTLREGVGWWAHQHGLTASMEGIHAKIGQTLSIENLHLESDGTRTSQTLADIHSISISVASPWQIFFGDGRILNRVGIQSADGVFDFRPDKKSPPHSQKVSTSEQNEDENEKSLLRFLPKHLKAEALNLEFLATHQSYKIEGGKMTLSEDAPGRLSVRETTVACGVVQQHFENYRGVTAWKDGVFYLSDLSLQNMLYLESFTADFVRHGGIALGFDIHAFGGDVRGDISFGSKDGDSFVDSALTANQLTLDSLPKFLGMNKVVSGFLREGRFTYHGSLESPLKVQASLRVVADKVRWNKRGWDTMTFSANLVDGKVIVPEFVLQQLENRVVLSGEATLPPKISQEDLEKTDYTITGSADIKDLSSLAALFGGPFQNTSGKLNLKTSLKGHGTDVSGNLSLQASKLTYRGAPAETINIETQFIQNEARVTKFEIHNKKDIIQASGTLRLQSPYSYTGEVTAKISDLSDYLGPFTSATNRPVYSGMVDARWQGDGTLTSHSGAFDIKLTQLSTDKTPKGISGAFQGTYSPENVYFSRIALHHEKLALSCQSTFAHSGIHIQNISLTGQNQTLAEGSMFLPVDAVKLANGISWTATVIPNSQIYAHILSRDIAIQDIGEIFGQQWPIMGNINLSLTGSGRIDAPKIQCALHGKALTITAKSMETPAMAFTLNLQTTENTASIDGNFTTVGFQPATLVATLPFHPKADETGNFHFFDNAAPFNAKFDFPKTSLAVFRCFLPWARNISGILSGHIAANNTLAAPRVNGHAGLTSGSVEITDKLPRLEKLTALITFDNDQLTLHRLLGAVAPGSFDGSGSADFKDLSNIHYRLQLRGSKIPLSRDSSIRLLANVDLSAAGDSRGGAINGGIRLVDGRMFKRLEITPLLLSATAEEQSSTMLPDFSKRAPKSFASWNLDITIGNETPFLVGENGEQGAITPKLRIVGTLDNPLPEGEILLNHFEVYFPFSVLDIPEGHIYFNAANPRVPTLDIRGTSTIQGYELHAQAFGPLTDHQLILRSIPPLSQEALSLLMSAGIAPSPTPASEQSLKNIVLLNALTRQFDKLSAIIELWRQVPPSNALSTMGESDTTDLYKTSILYTYRFR